MVLGGRHEKNKQSQSNLSQSSKDSRSLSKLTGSRGSVTQSSNECSQYQSKASVITEGVVKNQTTITQKQILLSQLNQQKKDMYDKITFLKRELMKTQKQTRQQYNEIKQVENEIKRFTSTSSNKNDKKLQTLKEIQLLKKEIKVLEKDCDDFKNWKDQMDAELKTEKELLEAVSQMVLAQKKQINEVKKEKEKLYMMNKNSQKLIESLAKRRDILNEDGNKLVLDFQAVQVQLENLPLQQRKQQITINTQSSIGKGTSSNYPNSPLKRGGTGNRSIPSTADEIAHKNGLNQFSINKERLDFDNFLKIKQELDDTIKDLDTKLNRVLAKQEYDYLKGYNVYVKRKEKELKDLIQKLSEKNQNSTFKDEKIRLMEMTLTNIRDDQVKMDKDQDNMRDKIKFWKTKAENAETEKNFLYNQVMDTKKKNKLLKVAIGRLQTEIEKINMNNEQKIKIDTEFQKSQFFITDILQAVEPQQKKVSPRINQSTYNPFESTQLNDISTVQHSLMEQQSVITNTNSKKVRHQSLNNTMIRKFQSTSVSRYANIPIQNLKFNKFIDLIFASKMNNDEIKEEIKKYVQTLETNYAEIIKEFKEKNEKLARQNKFYKSNNVNQVTEKADLEQLFVDCIEDVRKLVMKRRLKSEILSRKKFINQSFISDKNDEDAKEFEESLLKLANLAKNRIKITDFTTQDRFNILDLFVNNEKTLIKMYETLFPHRAGSMSMTVGSLKPLQQQSTARYSNDYGSIKMKTEINPDDYVLENLNTLKSPEDVQKEFNMNIKESESGIQGENVANNTRFPSLAKEGYRTTKASHNFKFSHLKQ